MTYLVTVPDEITPDNFSAFSVEERMKLIVAFKHSKPLHQLKDTHDVFRAAMDFYKTDNFALFVTDLGKR